MLAGEYVAHVSLMDEDWMSWRAKWARGRGAAAAARVRPSDRICTAATTTTTTSTAAAAAAAAAGSRIWDRSANSQPCPALESRSLSLNERSCVTRSTRDENYRIERHAARISSKHIKFCILEIDASRVLRTANIFILNGAKAQTGRCYF